MCDFYYTPYSPPCRSVRMLAKALNVDLNLKILNVREKKHLEKEFLDINPQHTIPTLVDNGFSIWESRAILGYLADKYDKTGILYPNNPEQRAVVNQRLFFDLGVLSQRFSEYIFPIMRQNSAADPEKLKKVYDAFEFLDTFLSKTQFVAGENATIADYAIYASITTIEVRGKDIDLSRFENISRWYAVCKSSLPGVEVNDEGVKAMKEQFMKMKEQK